MNDVDAIDERRARAIFNSRYPFYKYSECLKNGMAGARDAMACARAIRLSDEAAGYILIKHEGIISSEGMKPVEGE